MRLPEKYSAPDLVEAARRLQDTVNLHMTASNGECVGSWVAVKLADGRTDNNLYDTMGDAKRHQGGNAEHCGYLQIQPGVFALLEAAAFIYSWRALSASGVLEQSNPDRDVEVHIPQVLFRPGGLQI
jgi:hypothetical protein